MDLSTFLLLFIIFPYVFQPVLDNALSPTIPTSVDKSDHVVVCGLEQQRDRLISELEARDAEYVVVVNSEETTLDLMEENVPVIRGDPTAAETHEKACVGAAAAVLIDTVDRRSVSVLLAVRELSETIRTVVLVEDLEREQHLHYAGADKVLTPRNLLGQRITARIKTEINPTRSDTIPLGNDLSILELTVFEESPTAGKSVAEIESSAGETVTVSGMWQNGQFVRSPDPATTVDENTVLLLVGRDEELRDLERETYRGRTVEPTVIIAGHGSVGSTVQKGLERSHSDSTVVDIEHSEGVDIVGDVTEEATLQEAGIEEATIFVLTIANDDAAILSTVLASRLGTDLDIIVRLNEAANENKVRRAGADYVLSLPEVSSRVLAKQVLQTNRLSYSRQLSTVRIDATPYAGQPLDETPIADTTALVVAIERDDTVTTDVPSAFIIENEATMLVVGNDEQWGTISR
jgi:Trk K+ transport system NAD-binding subunit